MDQLNFGAVAEEVLKVLNPQQIADNLGLIMSLGHDLLKHDGTLSADSRLELQARLDALAHPRSGQ